MTAGVAFDVPEGDRSDAVGKKKKVKKKKVKKKEGSNRR